MKGRIASRAHSFKEGLLEAFGHHSGASLSPVNGNGHNCAGGGGGGNGFFAGKTASSPAPSPNNNIHLAKQTGSTDNLIGYTEPKHTTEGLVRDVQLALRYFEDAVHKGTFELLPGCASIVLERIVAVQSFVIHQSDAKDDEHVMNAMRRLYGAVSRLTQWADAVIVTGGGVEWTSLAEADCTKEVMDPVRKALKVLVHKLNASSNGEGGRGGGIHNSLPDITSPDADCPDSKGPPKLPKRCHHGSRSVRMTKSSSKRNRADSSGGENGIERKKKSGGGGGDSRSKRGERSASPPPLPPKNPLHKATPPPMPVADGYGGQADWFSNPLFDQQRAKRTAAAASEAAARKVNGDFESQVGDDQQQLSSPALGLDTTLPETCSFPYADEVDPWRDGPAATVQLKEPSERKRSQYDNVVDETIARSPPSSHSSSPMPPPPPPPLKNPANQHLFRGLMVGSQSFDSPAGERGGHRGGADEIASRRNSDGPNRSQHPPPLPPKRRDIINYMEVLGQSLLPSKEDLMQSLAQTQMLLENVWAENYHDFGEFSRQSQLMDHSSFNVPLTRDLFGHVNDDLSNFPHLLGSDDLPPPALPPKKNRTGLLRRQQETSNPSSQPSTPGRSSPSSSITTTTTAMTAAASSSPRERFIPIVREGDGSLVVPSCVTAANGPNNNGTASKRLSSDSANSSSASFELRANAPSTTETDVPQDRESRRHHHHHHHHHSHKRKKKKKRSPSGNGSSHVPTTARGTPPPEDSPLNQLEGPREGGESSLNYASNAEGMLELRAGSVDELIILATHSSNKDFVYQDAFLCTYRTFIATLTLLSKLQYRFRRFNGEDHGALELRAARSSFSLIVRIVDWLIDSDFHATDVMRNLSDFIAELVGGGELLLARALRSKFIEKYEEHRTRLLPDLDFGRLVLVTSSKQLPSLLHFKSSDLAEQITLLDAQHFWKLEPTELLLWVKEQNEEKSPNLVKFTKHFNAMSFWCRTRILQEHDPKERERLVLKFMKVMKFLRKHNNFNSYLALLSALDSASIRRLDWPKAIVDTIKEYSAIIDFTGSFKAYREALSRSSPPVIPYMGLVLQDLTFVHIGNQDYVKDKVNFAKRWQQYNILDNVRRFKRIQYPYQKREDVLRCFGNFDDALSENDLWELSEKIRPRQRASPAKLANDE